MIFNFKMSTKVANMKQDDSLAKSNQSVQSSRPRQSAMPGGGGSNTWGIFCMKSRARRSTGVLWRAQKLMQSPHPKSGSRAWGLGRELPRSPWVPPGPAFKS